ncbi:MAG: NAD(P)H-dependent glycerol-3-phosphate dehydrogenase [Pseudomonadota bacterium]
MAKELSIVGKGAFGNALRTVYQRAGFSVAQFGRELSMRLPGEFVLLAVPSQAVSDVVRQIECPTDQILVLCCKGLLPSGALPSSALPASHPFAVLSGPGFADEMQALLPTVHSLATELSAAEEIAAALSTPSFRLYWSNDPVGTQICGAYKNVLAIAAGIADGLAIGENARAALLVRGAAELRRIISASGGQEETVWSPAGFGDLALTCTSAKSRNFRFGQIIATGESPENAHRTLGTVEGIAALEGFVGAHRLLDTPIATMLHRVIHGKQTPARAVQELMQRPIKSG